MSSIEIALAEAVQDGLVLNGKPVNPNISLGRMVNAWCLSDEGEGSTALDLVKPYVITGITGTTVELAPVAVDGQRDGGAVQVDLEDFMRTGIHGSERFKVVSDFA